MKAIIVEQDPWIAELLRSVLRDLGGIETHLFDSAVSAINHLRSDRIRVGQTLQIPRTGGPGQPSAHAP